MIVTLENISKSYGASPVLREVTARIDDKDKIGLIGRNGAGKSTLLNIISGDLEPDSGDISRGGGQIGFLRQNSGLDSRNTIWQEMRGVFSELLGAEAEMRNLERAIAKSSPKDSAYADFTARYATLQGMFEQRDGYLIDVKIRTVLGGMGFADTDTQTPVGVLSGGEKTRLAICKLLLEQPELLILDEPTNHLDFRTLEWLEDYLSGYRGALLAVSHDRYFLDRLCGRIWELERHELALYPCGYSRYVEMKAERVERRLKEYEIQQRQIADMKEFIARNITRASTTARAQSRRAALEKLELAEKPRPPERPPKLEFTYRREPVKEVLHAQNIALSVGGAERRQLCRGINFDLERGDKIALVGVNGVGKTTFLKALLGKLQPDSGVIEWGVNTEISYFEQEEFAPSSGKSALNELWDRFPQKTENELRTVLGRMGISGENVHKRAGELSGGEQAKLKLASLVIHSGNVLLMDEPTNHLDLAAKEALDKALQNYTGTLLAVSHDRYLLNKFPSAIAEMTPEGIVLYKGNYESYMAQKKTESPLPRQTFPETPERPVREGGYRTKKQRAEQVARKQAIAALESEIEELEREISRLEERILLPEVAADYLLLRQICDTLEDIRKLHGEKLNRWSDIARGD